MAAILSAGVQSAFLPHSSASSSIDSMADASMADIWRRQQYHHLSLPLENFWPESHGTPMGGMHDTDLSMFQQDSADYQSHQHQQQQQNSYSNDATVLLSPQINYIPDTSWGSDMEIGTPPTSNFRSSDLIDTYHHLRTTSNPGHLTPLSTCTRHPVLSPSHSPQSAYSQLSTTPPLHATEPILHRPPITRSITAPAAPDAHHAHLPKTSPSTSSSSIKRSPSASLDEDFSSTIGPSDSKQQTQSQQPLARGRKRQRIPHTAVERRYRENLNAHLEKLRQNVPTLASRRGGSGGVSGVGGGGVEALVGDGVKPSKCEILNGAIEHIGALGRENAQLRTRLEELERYVLGK